MRKFKNHIAIVLIGLFIYPMAFGVIHSRSHSTDEFDSAQVLSFLNFYEGDAVASDLHSDDCAACDFEFFVNDVPQPELAVEEINSHVYHHFLFGLPQYNPKSLSSKCPRGPPTQHT